VQRPPLLEVIRGGAVADKLAAMPEPEIPPPAVEPTASSMPAALLHAAQPEIPAAPTHRPPSIDAGVHIPASAPQAPPEPRRSFSLFERLTGASRRSQDDR
jgi:hypothetical protein